MCHRPVILRFLRNIGVVSLVVLSLSCKPPTSSGPATDGDFLLAVSFGVENEDIGNAVCVDSSGNVYTTGSFQGVVDFDPGAGVFELDSDNGTNAVFITKLDSDGDLVWAKAITDFYACIGEDITIDTSGNILVTGFFWDTVDFNPGAATYNLTSAGQSDVFVLKLDSNGNFVWAQSMGGTQYDNGLGITTDSSGAVLLTGYFTGTAEFDGVAGAPNLTSAGDLDIFICKLNSSGTYVWAKGIGGTSEDRGLGIDTDTSGNVYTTGFFQGNADFDPDPDVAETFPMDSAGGYDAFISKLDSSGDFVWATKMGAAMEDEGRGIAIDTSGNVYTTGYFRQTVDFDPGAGSSNLVSDNSSQDVFVSKLDSSGNYVWAGAMGGSSNDQGNGISLDNSGNIFTTGLFQNTGDFDPGTGTYNLAHDALNDVFISKLDSDGDFVWAKAMSGSNDEGGNGVAADTSSNVYVTGYFIDTVDFDPGAGTFNMTSDTASKDIFVAYIDGP